MKASEICDLIKEKKHLQNFFSCLFHDLKHEAELRGRTFIEYTPYYHKCEYEMYSVMTEEKKEYLISLGYNIEYYNKVIKTSAIEMPIYETRYFLNLIPYQCHIGKTMEYTNTTVPCLKISARCGKEQS